MMNNYQNIIDYYSSIEVANKIDNNKSNVIVKSDNEYTITVYKEQCLFNINLNKKYTYFLYSVQLPTNLVLQHSQNFGMIKLAIENYLKTNIPNNLKKIDNFLFYKTFKVEHSVSIKEIKHCYKIMLIYNIRNNITLDKIKYIEDEYYNKIINFLKSIESNIHEYLTQNMSR